jgi:hypothetical protein
LTVTLRVLFGTAIYVVIVVLAAPFPSAAGLMLVFPTLNGLAFVFSERDRVLPMVPSMLWMPVVNGVLCAAYLLVFLALAPVLPSVALAWALTVAAIALFVVPVRTPCVRKGIPPTRQRTFALGATVACLALVAIARQGASGLAAGALAPADAGVAGPQLAAGLQLAAAAAAHNLPKILVFASCLAVFLVASRVLRLSDSTRGILAGLPFAPFGGLVSIAGDASIDLPARLDIVRHMAVSVWLGPAIAIWFIYGFPRALVRLRPQSGAAVPALVVAWLLCAAAIAAAAVVLR